MKTKKLDIQLKGDRDYVHGTDLVDLVYPTLAEGAGGALDTFEIAFHRMGRRQAELIWDTDTPPEGTFANGAWARGAKRGRFWVREGTAVIDGRRPYPEEEIVAQLTYDEGNSEARLLAPLSFSDIEHWIPMIKAMHQRRFADAAGKWVFARAKLRAYDPRHGPSSLRVALAATLGTKLTRNEVYLNDEKIGDVFFALM